MIKMSSTNKFKLCFAFVLLFALIHSSAGQNKGSKVGDISRQKCREYAKYAYENSDSPDEKPECTFTVKSPIEDVEENAPASEFPHIVKLGYNSSQGIKWLCGGSLISEQYVLTVAHCFTTTKYGSPNYAVLGMTNLNDHEYLKWVEISEIITHPNYIVGKFYNDIGLVKLSEPVRFNPSMRPACLYTESGNPNGKALVAGWGRLDLLGKYNDNILKTSVELVDHSTCKSYYGTAESLSEGVDEYTMFCAKLSTKNTTNCQQESGSPVLLYGSDDVPCTYQIVGLASFGTICRSESLDGYQRVYGYLEWIEETVWSSERKQ